MSNLILSNNAASNSVLTTAYLQILQATTFLFNKIWVTDSTGKILKLASAIGPVKASLATTAPIVFTALNAGSLRNGNTIETVINAAAANPTNTVLVAITGTSAAIIITVTPNDGTHNSAVPVNLTSAQLVQLINTGSVTGINVTLTDASSLRAIQTATGGGVDVLAHSGNGDTITATFSAGQVDLFQLPVNASQLLTLPSQFAVPVGSSLWLKSIDSAAASSGISVVTLLS
jgi:hypothetical protein